VEPRKIPNRERDMRGIEIINRNAKRLNREALDVTCSTIKARLFRHGMIVR
jgi:hypothetical protein